VVTASSGTPGRLRLDQLTTDHRNFRFCAGFWQYLRDEDQASIITNIDVRPLDDGLWTVLAVPGKTCVAAQLARLERVGRPHVSKDLRYRILQMYPAVSTESCHGCLSEQCDDQVNCQDVEHIVHNDGGPRSQILAEACSTNRIRAATHPNCPSRHTEAVQRALWIAQMTLDFFLPTACQSFWSR